MTMQFTSFILEADRTGCVKLLRDLQRNPPKNTEIAINPRLAKAKYSCQEGFILSGVKIRTCRAGRWKEKKNPKCSGAFFYLFIVIRCLNAFVTQQRSHPVMCKH